MAEVEAPSTGGAQAHVASATFGALPKSGILLLIALSITWGLNWPMMKLALQDIPVWTFRSLCLMVGGSLLLLLSRLASHAVMIPRDRLFMLALVAVFNVTGWHLCSAYGLLHTGGGRAAIIGYTMPLWTSIFSIWILKTKPTGRHVLALICGMAAMLALISKDLKMVGDAPLGVLFMTMAALNWAFGTVLVKKFDWRGMSVMALTGWQQLLGGIPIVIGWFLLEPIPEFGDYRWSALLGLGYVIFVAMVFCHTTYFKLVSLLPAHIAAMGTLAVPVVGVVSSAWILDEVVGPSEMTALVLVVSSLGLLFIGKPGGS